MFQKKKTSTISGGLASRQRSHRHEERNLPIPLVLFTSYIAAEKSDQLIKSFCKELPGILKKIKSSKEALERKTKSVYGLKEDLMLDLKKLELAKLVLKELFTEEEVSKVSKEQEIQALYSEISSYEDSKKVMNNAMIQYSKSKQALDVVAVDTGQYSDALALIHSCLTLQDMNERFITEDYMIAQNIQSVEGEDVGTQNLLLKYKYNIVIREKKLENLLNKYQALRNLNYKLTQSMNDISLQRIQDQLTKFQIKRWTYDICQKIGTYKETPLSTEDFLKLLTEIQDFIVFARQIILKLEQEKN